MLDSGPVVTGPQCSNRGKLTMPEAYASLSGLLVAPDKLRNKHVQVETHIFIDQCLLIMILHSGLHGQGQGGRGVQLSSSTCLMAHPVARALHEVSRDLNIRLSVSWKCRCSDKPSRVADYLTKREMEAARAELGVRNPTLGYTSRTLAVFMQNPRLEGCLGKAILEELNPWRETLEVHGEWSESYQYLVKLPSNT